MTTFTTTFAIAYAVIGVAFATFLGWPRGEVLSVAIRLASMVVTAAIWPFFLYRFIGLMFLPAEELERMLGEDDQQSSEGRRTP